MQVTVVKRLPARSSLTSNLAQNVSNLLSVSTGWILFPTLIRFEKSLYDLIKGLRNHKGSEEDYIQNSLRECRAEIRSQDMGEPISYGVYVHVFS
jgi:hypothetical protein